MSLLAALLGLVPALVPVVQTGHSGPLDRVLFSQDGRHLVTIASDELKWWTTDGLLIKNGRAQDELKGLGLIESSRGRAADYEGAVTVFRKDGRPYEELGVGELVPSGVFIGPAGRGMVAAYRDGSFRLFREDGSIVHTYYGARARPVDLSFSPDGRRLAVASFDGTVRLWRVDHKNSRLISRFSGSKAVARRIVLREGDLSLMSTDGILRLRDTAGRRKKSIQVGRPGLIADAPGENFVVSHDGTVSILSKKGKRLHSYKAGMGQVVDLAVSLDGKIAALYARGRVAFLDAEAKLLTMRDLDARPLVLAFDPRGEQVVIGQRDGWITVVTIEGAVRSAFQTEDVPRGVALGASEGEEPTILSSGSAGVRRWSLSGKALKTLHTGLCDRMALNIDGGIAAICNGAVWLSRGPAQTLIASGDDWLSFDDEGQVVRFRDGAALAALVDQDLREGLSFAQNGHLLWKEKVLGKAPLAWVSKSAQVGRLVELDIELEARERGIAAYNVLVDGRPLYPAPGRKVSVPSGGLARVVERFELGHGRNRVKAVALDNRSITSDTSDASSIELHYRGEASPRLFFVGIGVGRYRSKRLRLRYGDKDALDLAGIFRRISSKAFGARTEILTYFNSAANEKNIEDALKSIEARANADDMLVVFVAGRVEEGHLLNTRSRVAMSLIFDGMERSVCRSKLLLLDTIDQSLVSKEQVQAYEALAKRRKMRFRLGGAMAAPTIPGVSVLSAGWPAEPSFEMDVDSNGLFAQEIINGLTSARADRDLDALITLEELAAYVERAVFLRSYDRQAPLFWSEGKPLSFPRVSRHWDVSNKPLRGYRYR